MLFNTFFFNSLGILLIALKGLSTLIVLIAVKFVSTCEKYSKAPDITMKKSKRFHESAKYVPLPQKPMAIIFMSISNVKNANITSSKTYENGRQKREIIIKILYKKKSFTKIFISSREHFTCKILQRFFSHLSSTHG